MSFRSKERMWPLMHPKPEDALFTIILHPDVYLYKAGSKIQGDVCMNFKETKEEISFQYLNVYFKENVNLPEKVSAKKNVTARIITENRLIDRDNASHIYDYYVSQVNESNEVRIPFEIHLPIDLASSFNSKQLTTCYEIKAEITKLMLCGELCEMSTSQSIEVKEFLPEVIEWSQSAQLQRNINGKFMTFSASIDKPVYHTDDEMKLEIHLDIPDANEVMFEFRIMQVIELKQHSQWQTMISSIKEPYPVQKNGIFNITQTFFLENSLYNSQPTVRYSDFLDVSYSVTISAVVENESVELDIPFVVEREHALCDSYQNIFSAAGLPLLPLTITVNELKTDGLQSYIPLKQCYENRRLSVRRGDLSGLHAVLTIVSESYKPYTQSQKIKGYVYFKVAGADDDVKFGNLLIILVGVKKDKNGSTLRSRNGEMFLFERKILKGDKNRNESEVVLSKESGMMVVEFEFDLSLINKTLPPSFNSDDVTISYELKADVFNLLVGEQRASLYTTLPIVIKEERNVSDMEVSGLRAANKISGKDVSVFVSTDKFVYQHNDVIQVKINVENKSKKQVTVKLRLVKVEERLGCSLDNADNLESVVSRPIIILVLPKGKLVSTETIPLKDALFHYQPSVTNFDEFSVTYKVCVEVPLQSQDIKGEIPIKILRRHGHNVKEITREGYPLLHLTLEIYGKALPNLSSFLTEYDSRGLVKVMISESCFDRWKGWKLK